MKCVDAETLATWMDGGLRGAALEDVRAHVSGCDRCQMLLGAMGRTRVAVPASEPERAPRRWLAWAVPLTAAATALAVWIAVPEQKSVPAVAPATAPVAGQEAPAAAPAPAPAAPVPSAPTETRQAAPRASAPPPPAVAPPAAEPAAAAPLLAPREEARARDQQQRAAAQGPLTESITIAPQSATSPTIESLCGRMWGAPPGDVTGALTAGSSPSPDVCWVVGRGGVVQRSTNGQTWQRIPFPDMTDLSGVEASDARAARVSTADGRSFTTSDGGMTWVPQ